MVIFLTGLVSMILLRTLRADYARYTRDDDDLEALERDMNEESGWKLVHGDVFRSPKYLELLAALIGTGCQLAVLTLLVILVTIAGKTLLLWPSLVSVSLIQDWPPLQGPARIIPIYHGSSAFLVNAHLCAPSLASLLPYCHGSPKSLADQAAMYFICLVSLSTLSFSPTTVCCRRTIAMTVMLIGGI